MSDFFNNNNGSETNEQNDSGTYSYKKEQINQGESYYQWSPYDDGNRVKKKKTKTFGKKLGNAAAIALVFGIVAGLAFQSIVAVTNRLWNLENAKQPAIESTQSTDSSKKDSSKVDSTNTATGTTTATKITTDVSEIAKNVLPAIVQVTNAGIKEYQTFFGTMQQQTTSAGSGIIVAQDDENIYIATNNHVVSGAETLTITFNDDQAVEGTIKGADSSCDLAVVSVAVTLHILLYH